jgi:hypothetical protein
MGSAKAKGLASVQVFSWASAAWIDDSEKNFAPVEFLKLA